MDKPIPATPFAPWQRLAAETGLLARMSVPILLAQFAQVGMNFVDTVMAGHYSAEALAGVAVASSVWWPVIMLAVGVLLALPAMSAQLVGARRRERAAHLLRQGVWLAALLSAA
ncbi:MAG: MATE family efflux transporter, partial [Desulfovibrionaceae bacterium]|nr:MATE family efflux transporter [Desulfovibrionaceae bacterium]